MASSPPTPYSGGSCCWSIVSSAVFVPTSASWVLLSSPLQPPCQLFLSPPSLHLSLSSFPSLVFPLPSLSFSWFPSASACNSGPPPPSTILFAAFHHVPSHQTHKLAIRFPSASHCLQFLETAATLGAHSSPRLTHDLSLIPVSSSSHCYRHADLDVSLVSSRAPEVYTEPLPSPDCTATATPLAAQGTAPDCPALREVQDAPIPSLRSPSSIAIPQNVAAEPEVYAADSRNLCMERNEPDIRTRCTRITPLSRFFPATRCPSITAASSISLGSASRFMGIHNDNALFRQTCDKGFVASEVEDQQQSSPRGIENELDNADDTNPASIILTQGGASNRPQEQSLQQRGWGLDTRGVDICNTHASKADSGSGDLRSELLGCLLDPSFRLLVERVEDLVGEIDNPANIDLVALADFLSSRK